MYQLKINIYNHLWCPFISNLASFLSLNSMSIFMPVKVAILKLTLMRMGQKIYIESGFKFYMAKNIKLSSNVALGHDNSIWAFHPVRIGNWVQTARGLTIITGSHDVGSFAPKMDRQEVVLEGENWIGANVTILGGVTVGRGAIIGAGSLVNKDIPAYTIAAGNPAKVLRSRIPSQEVIHPFGTYRPLFYENIR